MLFLLLINLALSSSFVSIESNKKTCSKEKGTVGNYSYNLFAAFWAGTQCLKYNPKPGYGPIVGSNLVTIHGLWPGNNASSWPECCNNSYPYDSSELDDVEDLEKNWVSSTGSDDTFYAHEWEKHGTCAMDLFDTEKEYFQSTVNLNKRLDIAGLLADAGITPGTKAYKKTAVKAAIKAGTGYDPLLECYTINNQKMLAAIYVCVDKTSDLNTRNCTSDYYSKYESKCPASFYLPAIPSSCYK